MAETANGSRRVSRHPCRHATQTQNTESGCRSRGRIRRPRHPKIQQRTAIATESIRAAHSLPAPLRHRIFRVRGRSLTSTKRPRPCRNKPDEVHTTPQTPDKRHAADSDNISCLSQPPHSLTRKDRPVGPCGSRRLFLLPKAPSHGRGHRQNPGIRDNGPRGNCAPSNPCRTSAGC